MFNVIKAGMSKWAKLVQILVNDKGFRMPFLRATHLPVAHGIYQIVSNIRKLVGVEIKQTARKLETNAHANFLTAGNMAYQCMEDGRWNMPTLTLSWLIVPFRHNVETKSET